MICRLNAVLVVVWMMVSKAAQVLILHADWGLPSMVVGDIPPHSDIDQRDSLARRMNTE